MNLFKFRKQTLKIMSTILLGFLTSGLTQRPISVGPFSLFLRTVIKSELVPYYQLFVYFLFFCLIMLCEKWENQYVYIAG